MTRTEHLLVCLIEECAEVQKEATKALRFGLDDFHEVYPTNSTKISLEMVDLLAVFEMLIEEGAIISLQNDATMNAKKARVEKFMQYAIERGTTEQVKL